MLNVDSYINTLPDERSALVQYLRHFILSVHPDISDCLKYGTLFFMCCGTWLCYINAKKTEVDIGFPRAPLMKDEQGALQQKGRKIIKTISFGYNEDVNTDVLRILILEAVRVNQSLPKKKKKA